MYILIEHFFYLVATITALITLIYVLRQRSTPQSTIAWVLAIVLLPYIGVITYLLFGNRKRRSDVDKNTLKFAANIDTISSLNISHRIERMLVNYQIEPAKRGNYMRLCETGVEGYHGLIEVIEAAKHYICIATFIFSHDEIAEDILNRLIKQVKKGVKVYLLVDGLGSLKTSRFFFDRLVKAGGHFAWFKPVLHIPFLKGYTNLRNHRKIALSDGMRAFVGGMNITHEDLSRTARQDLWQDLSFLVEGPIVRVYLNIFTSDWRYSTHRFLETPVLSHDLIYSGQADLQVVPSGPDVPMDPLYDAMMTAIYSAESRIEIVTPYFIPNESMLKALQIACRRGVAVKIIVPEKSNHFISDIARASFLRDIKNSGGSILLYQKTMLHAKIMIVDNSLAVVGSANIDMRSLFFNYEVMQFIYSQLEIDMISSWVDKLSQDCISELKPPALIREMVEGLVRMIEPLL